MLDRALSDGYLTVKEAAELTDLELRELEAVAAMLDIDEELFLAALPPRPATALHSLQAAPVDIAQYLQPGNVVVLTGDMWLPRHDLEQLLLARGVVVRPGTTKKTTLLVAADVTSLSGKARKGRDYGVPVAAGGSRGGGWVT
ncbi:BRCT domain-containing protein [Frondihabitans cladoniiphilus]|uniref:Uncharacterized protein n=1 Tax=Frondihabitans cladoniiphilus TaxID=715785 RepID=A0ABP8WBX4_9MICO